MIEEIYNLDSLGYPESYYCDVENIKSIKLNAYGLKIIFMDKSEYDFNYKDNTDNIQIYNYLSKQIKSLLKIKIKSEKIKEILK